MPLKRRVVDTGEERPIVVDIEEGDFTLQETVVVHVGARTGVDFKAPHLEEMSVDASSCPAGETVEGGMPNDGLALLR